MKYGKFLGTLEHIEIVLSFLTFMVDFNMNLMSEFYHEYKRRGASFLMFQEYLKITHEIYEINMKYIT